MATAVSTISRTAASATVVVVVALSSSDDEHAAATRPITAIAEIRRRDRDFFIFECLSVSRSRAALASSRI